MSELSETPKVLGLNEFSLRLDSSRAENEAPQSEVILRGAPSGVFLTGAVLEAVVKIGRGYVVFTTDDVPFEEFLNVHYLDGELAMLDRATLGAMYCTGHFTELDVLSPTQLRFQFIGGCPWTVTVLPNPKAAFPFFSNAKGVSRRLSLFRHFTLEGKPFPNVG